MIRVALGWCLVGILIMFVIWNILMLVDSTTENKKSTLNARLLELKRQEDKLYQAINFSKRFEDKAFYDKASLVYLSDYTFVDLSSLARLAVSAENEENILKRIEERESVIEGLLKEFRELYM